MSIFPFDWTAPEVDWQHDAACLGAYDILGKDIFFPPDNPGGPKKGKGIAGERERIRMAKAVCATCPVLEECLQYATEHQLTGIWGGMTDRERKIRKWEKDNGSAAA